MDAHNPLTRRQFVSSTSRALAGAILVPTLGTTMASATLAAKSRMAMVGTGIRGIRMWGKDLIQEYPDLFEFVGLCDSNPGRAAFARSYMGVTCPTFTDFEEMLRKARPDTVIVTTVDATHHTFIAKALAMGCNVITEKPMTTDEMKLKEILDAQKKSDRKLVVTFNYRYTPHRARIKELLMQDRIGRITSVDFHWYLDTDHGASYFRRWHGIRKHSGSLLLHKATHHFDLLNWWIDSDPERVHAFGALEFYGRNNAFRHTHCRTCPHTAKCRFYFDMTKDPLLMSLYADQEKYDGYIRDACLWREEIDIFDKMAVQIKYANAVQVSYSLTTYSPYEGYRIAFNGTKGRLEAWIHENQPWPLEGYDELRITDMFGKTELVRIQQEPGGHGGGDRRMKERIFRGPGQADPLGQAAGVRDGAMSIMIGIAARQSIDSGMPVDIRNLSELIPQVKRPT
ncbi:MAG: 4,5-dihydroxyphthalate dehydrogenase [Bacteroidetes bacterium]|nr:4,5-dihydroxyphthalate dehydrogenase [Bacteroidota bacterium]